MKTADLIPFILLELEESDKYGFELTKNIETKSSGKIIIKQPTLYTLLKKLEKSKFISSYWEDSEIGGKRHYYRLTENGRMQVSTLPSYEILMKNASNEEVLDEEIETHHSSNSFIEQQEEKHISIMDELLNQQPEPVETILPTEEVFNNKTIDTSTELEINLSNTEILKDNKVSADEQFATNKDVSKFTEKMHTAPSTNISTDYRSSTNDILNKEFVAPTNALEIKSVDYVDFKNIETNKFAKRIAKKKLWQVLSTSGCLILMLALCELITNFTGHSALYYIYFIPALLIAIFYPVLYIININKFRLKIQNNQYSPKLKQHTFIGLTMLLATLIVSIVVSICLKHNTITLMLGAKNFANIYAPALIVSTYFLDILFNHLFISKIK